MDAPGGAAAEIRDLALTASQVEKNTLAWWAAYYQEPALSLGAMVCRAARSRRIVATPDARCA